MSLVKEKFPEHLRKSWNQWHITKKALIVPSEVVSDVVIRTREDYQEDLKFLCTSETVATHRGIGVITMLCYPIVMEIFKGDGTSEMIGIVYMSDTKSKNFITVRCFENMAIAYIKSFG